MKLSAVLIALIMVLSPAMSSADNGFPLIQITVKNSSLRRGYFEVKDLLCPSKVSSDCITARMMLNSKKCRDPKWAKECRDLRAIVDGPECVEGHIFYGWLEKDEKIQLNICTDHTGTGQVETRNSPTAPWVRYGLVKDGQTISVQ